jgi:hypothetical protein
MRYGGAHPDSSSLLITVCRLHKSTTQNGRKKQRERTTVVTGREPVFEVIQRLSNLFKQARILGALSRAIRCVHSLYTSRSRSFARIMGPPNLVIRSGPRGPLHPSRGPAQRQAAKRGSPATPQGHAHVCGAGSGVRCVATVVETQVNRRSAGRRAFWNPAICQLAVGQIITVAFI